MKILTTIATASWAITILLTVLSVTGMAQSGNSSVSGIVRDAAGAAVDGAEVSLVHAQSVLRTAITNTDGKFTIDNVAPGSYALMVTRSGFGRLTSAVQLKPGDKKELELTLEVNPLSEEVTVTAEAGLVSEARTLAQPVNVITEQEIGDRGTEVVAQVVDEEQGVNLQRTSPSLSAVFVRGLTGRNVAVYVDGVRYTTSAQRGGVGTFFSLMNHQAWRPWKSSAVPTAHNTALTRTAASLISFPVRPCSGIRMASFTATPAPFIHR